MIVMNKQIRSLSKKQQQQKKTEGIKKYPSIQIKFLELKDTICKLKINRISATAY